MPRRPKAHLDPPDGEGCFARAVPALLRRWELRTGRVLSVSQPLQKAGFPDITHNLRKRGKEPTQTPLSLYQHGHSCEQVGMGLSV